LRINAFKAVNAHNQKFSRQSTCGLPNIKAGPDMTPNIPEKFPPQLVNWTLVSHSPPRDPDDDDEDEEDEEDENQDEEPPVVREPDE
jgi:hypothetical protein